MNTPQSQVVICLEPAMHILSVTRLSGSIRSTSPFVVRANISLRVQSTATQQGMSFILATGPAVCVKCKQMEKDGSDLVDVQEIQTQRVPQHLISQQLFLHSR